ncbi:hypothetical protein N7474_001848 [Penicillium riverlandense]|uniref:uncharacterized protein n=1 Tax=Penicillium riverlandense TaxID=1903569 RepID=UPI00254842F8|nr:uncharacterized protein N7474_001848 [Penicillium riverlandense]KAJ5833537.1 hypothetical protein N7474_001848 [Penicillium riverlandense]
MQASNFSKPWLLYAYPWQPFPRRLVIYLRERSIPSSLVTVVPVSDLQFGGHPPAGFPPKPSGSLPILVIPQGNGGAPKEAIYIKQSIAIMEFIEETCLAGRHGFPKIPPISILPLKMPVQFGDDDAAAICRAKHSELLSLAVSLTEGWNPIRIFGSGTGTMRVPDAAREMLQWLKRGLLSVERWMDENEYSPDSLIWEASGSRKATIAEIVLFQFFEFTKDCYGIDMTLSSGKQTLDVYGREVVEAYPQLNRFYEVFLSRPSARRNPELGEVPHADWIKKMTEWSPGIFEV